MKFTVILAKDAAKKLSKLDSKTKARIQERLLQLAEDPYNSRIGKPLVNALGRWSSRVGATWRIVYRVKLDPRWSLWMRSSRGGKSIDRFSQ